MFTNRSPAVLLSALALGSLTADACIPLAARPAELPTRRIVVDASSPKGPIDRFFDLSVGSDFPGTLMRDDGQAQLKVAVDELGFRYIRFHAIFHDVLGTVQRVDGMLVYDWSKLDGLDDGLLAKHIRPCVELGFTPEALATSRNTIFYWKGNTSHPQPAGWRDLVGALIHHHLEERYGRDEVRSWYFEFGDPGPASLPATSPRNVDYDRRNLRQFVHRR